MRDQIARALVHDMLESGELPDLLDDICMEVQGWPEWDDEMGEGFDEERAVRVEDEEGVLLLTAMIRILTEVWHSEVQRVWGRGGS